MSVSKKAFNPHLSVDCVIFGFDGSSLQVLVIERDSSTATPKTSRKYKLPGDLIHIQEDLDGAANRVLTELTGLKNIFLRQYAVFGKPERISNPDDLQWLKESSKTDVSRVVTTAYYALIRIDKSKTENANNYNASWHNVDELPDLVFDHREIIESGINSLRLAIRHEPICFELLPGKFTIRQIQTLYEAIVGAKLDNRNFRKKLLKASYLEPLNEKQQGVAHKPAMFYRFDRIKYQESKKDILNYNF